MPKISVIVPVYKAEKYLNRCVDSILAQTFTDFELLLIDDGSPDRSGEICDEYARKDSRIRVFHKENGGVSSARQKGMDEAVGDYTIHADPDDWVEPTMLEELYAKAKAEDADMVICDFYREYGNGTGLVCNQSLMSLSAEVILKQLMFQQLHGSCCNKLVRRACYTKYNVKFPAEIICWEDLFVNCELLMHQIKVAYLPKPLYHYDIYSNSSSIVRTGSMRRINSQICFIEHFKNIGISDDMLFRCKCVTKELAFNSDLMPDGAVISLFNEVNDRYIKDISNSEYTIGLKALIRGERRVAHIFRLFLIFHSRLSKTRVYQELRKIIKYLCHK